MKAQVQKPLFFFIQFTVSAKPQAVLLTYLYIVQCWTGEEKQRIFPFQLKKKMYHKFSLNCVIAEN